MNEQTFIQKIKELGIRVNSEQLEKLRLFCDLLISENEKYNLTSITDEDDIYLKHFYDSLTICLIQDLKKVSTILDVGSGAGFPGIVLKIFFPHLKLTLLDSNNKKTYFMSILVNKLKLTNTKIINERAEEYIVGNRNEYDLVVSRAVASLNVLIELCIPYVKIGGKFIAMKGRYDDEELNHGLITCEALKCEIHRIQDFNLPIENSERTIVIVSKNEDTPSIYPRRYDKIIKNPLKKE